MRSFPRFRAIAGLALLLAAACRPAAAPSRAAGREAAPAAVAARPDRGPALYAAYCAACHGAEADGHGELAEMLGLRVADLRAQRAWAETSDAAIVERLLVGEPLIVPAGSAQAAEDLDVDAIAAYLPRLATADWELLRAGRLVYEGACASCHGAYGHGEGALAAWLGVTDLIEARDRLPDATLARISHAGIGTMPPLADAFDPGEVRALVAYIRYLSDGFRLYDTYCATCHGDDGQGLYTRDPVPPATIAPPLRPPHPRARLVHMLRRERGSMPHFQDVLGAADLEAVVAYLRARAAAPGAPPAGS